MSDFSRAGKMPSSKKFALAEALRAAKRCSESDVVTYLNSMLHYSPDNGERKFLIGNETRRLAGLNHFLSEAVPMDPGELTAALNRGVLRGDPIWRHFPSVAEYFRGYSEDFVESPLRAIFFEVISHPDYWRGIWSIFDDQSAGVEKNYKHVAAAAFEKLVLEIRTLAQTKKIWKKMDDWSFPVNVNVVRVNNYVNYLFERCSTVAVTELEVLYPQSIVADFGDALDRRDAIDWQKERDRQAKLHGVEYAASDPSPVLVPAPPIDSLARDLRRFFENLGNKRVLSKYKIGHVTSIEWSRVLGHYGRIMIFFDGTQITDPLSHADLLGEYIGHVTNGQMAFQNCGRRDGTGSHASLISSDDDLARKALHKKLLLWAQKEQFLRIRASSGFKTFRSADIPLPWRALP